MIFTTIKNFFSSLINVSITGIVILVMIFIWAAQIKSCFSTSDKNPVQPKLNIVQFDKNNKSHTIISNQFTKIASNIYPSKFKFDYLFVRDVNTLNAASFGNGRFIFWEFLANLPSFVIDSILAHEIAHDILLHSKKKSDLDDLRNFFIEIIGMTSNRKSEKVMHEWSSNLVLPVYSRSQELEADTKAIYILSLAGYSKPKQVYFEMLSYLRNKYGNSGGGFFDSHPSLDERIQNIANLR